MRNVIRQRDSTGEECDKTEGQHKEERRKILKIIRKEENKRNERKEVMMEG